MTPVTKLLDMMPKSAMRTANNWRKAILQINAEKMEASSNVASDETRSSAMNAGSAAPCQCAPPLKARDIA